MLPRGSAEKRAHCRTGNWWIAGEPNARRKQILCVRTLQRADPTRYNKTQQRYRGEVYYRKGLAWFRWPRSPTIGWRPCRDRGVTQSEPESQEPGDPVSEGRRTGILSPVTEQTHPSLPFCSFQALNGLDDAPRRATESNAHLFQKPLHTPQRQCFISYLGVPKPRSQRRAGLQIPLRSVTA